MRRGPGGEDRVGGNRVSEGRGKLKASRNPLVSKNPTVGGCRGEYIYNNIIEFDFFL